MASEGVTKDLRNIQRIGPQQQEMEKTRTNHSKTKLEYPFATLQIEDATSRVRQPECAL